MCCHDAGADLGRIDRDDGSPDWLRNKGFEVVLGRPNTVPAHRRKWGIFGINVGYRY